MHSVLPLKVSFPHLNGFVKIIQRDLEHPQLSLFFSRFLPPWQPYILHSVLLIHVQVPPFYSQAPTPCSPSIHLADPMVSSIQHTCTMFIIYLCVYLGMG